MFINIHLHHHCSGVSGDVSVCSCALPRWNEDPDSGLRRGGEVLAPSVLAARSRGKPNVTMACKVLDDGAFRFRKTELRAGYRRKVHEAPSRHSGEVDDHGRSPSTITVIDHLI